MELGYAGDFIISHKGQKLQWAAGEFGKKYFEPEMRLVDHINAFWATLPAHRQDAIWSCYFRIHDALNHTSDALMLIRILTPLVQELYAAHGDDLLSRLEIWISHAAGINIPSRFKDEYVHSDAKPGTREKTYIRSDYVKLVVLSLALRPIVPIWSEFLRTTKGDTGTNYKELYAYALLAKTPLYDCAAMERMRTYIKNIVKPDQPMTDSIVRGIGSEDFADALLASLMVTRICVGDIRGLEDQPCLVITSYKYITQETRQQKGGGANASIARKDFATGDGDNEPSRLESYKPKAEHAQGDLSPYKVYADNIEVVARRLTSDIDLDLLRLLLDNNQKLRKEPLLDAQLTLMQYVIAPVISPRAVFNMPKETVVKLLSLAQCVLWQKGHRKLSLFTTSVPVPDGDEMMLSGIGTTARLPKEHVAELERLYPYTRLPLSRPNAKVVNDAINAIDIQSQRLIKSDWFITAPDFMVVEATGKLQRRVGCPHDIKICLADLAIQIANRTLLNPPVSAYELLKQQYPQ